MATRPSHLVIPDCHAHPDFSNTRFKALGRLIAAIQPTKIICLGDWADMPSLCSYDEGKRGFEGRRYKKDIEAAVDAQAQMWNEVHRKAPRYKPDAWMDLGNHEDRITRAVNDDARLEGTISLADLEFERFGWKVSAYQDILLQDGICYSHHFAAGVSGRPIGGENIARAYCTKLHVSAVAGHAHVFDHAERTRADGRKIFGLCAGCYTSSDHIEGWNMATAKMWWRGVVYLGDLDGHGYYDEIRAVTQRKIFRDFL